MTRYLRVALGMVVVVCVMGMLVSSCGGSKDGSPTAPTSSNDPTPTTTVAHELGICGVTTFESSQRPTLLPIVIPEGDPMHGVGFHHCMQVFGASMWAVEKFSEPLLRHVASIAAEYLDNNEDGVVDDPAMNTALVDNYAAMYLVDAFDKFSKFDLSDQSPIHRMKITVAQHSGETNPQGSLCGSHCGQPNDSTREEVLHLIQQAGYGFAYPALRPQEADGPLPDNLLTDAMRISQQNGDYQTN